jgi:hypothetical protein
VVNKSPPHSSLNPRNPKDSQASRSKTLRTRFKSPRTFLCRKTARCPSCKLSFDSGKIKVVFREVVECLECGFIWVSDDEVVGMH